METTTRKLVLKSDANVTLFLYKKDTEECATLTVTDRLRDDFIDQDIGDYVIAFGDHNVMQLSLHSPVIPDKIKETIDSLNSIHATIKHHMFYNTVNKLEEINKTNELSKIETTIGDCILKLQGLGL